MEDIHVPFTTCLFPYQLHQDWKECLLENVKNEYEKKTHKSLGYIDQIHSIARVISNRQKGFQGLVCFDFVATVRRYLPKVGDRVVGTIHMIFEHGIFIDYYAIRCLVPIKDILRKGGSFSRRPVPCIVFPTQSVETQKIMTTGQPVPILLQRIRFENRIFSCLAVLDDDLPG